MTASQFNQSDLMDILVEAAGLPVADRSTDADAGFNDIGLDSLAFLQLQTELSTRYGVELPDDLAQGAFGDMVALVVQHLPNQKVA